MVRLKNGYGVCLSCQRHRKIENPKTVTKSGRKFTQGKCEKCGGKISRTGAYKESSAKKAHRTNKTSEFEYIELLRKELGSKSLVFSTGKVVGVPDIVSYHRKKIMFHEIKPGYPKNSSDLKNPFLKPTQENWIMENCLKKNIPVEIVYYHKKERKLRGDHWVYQEVKLTKKNLKKYSQSSSWESRDRTMHMIESWFE